ncbi:MAG TPA: hypothetical protein VGD65_20360 [Chryseosolibacter sp.]
MQKADANNSATALSVEKIIDLIRSVRNDLVKDFLNDDVLNKYYEEKFGKPLSTVKKEFFRRDLRELLIAPVDLVHYAKLITHIRETGTASLARKNSEFFYSDIDRVISRY